MQGFEDVTLGWKGESYTIPANKMLLLIAKIEDAIHHATKEDEDGPKLILPLLLRKHGVPHPLLAIMFGTALRYAGASVSNDEVYLAIHEDIARGTKQEVAAKVNTAVLSLVAVISPPVFANLTGKATPAKKP